MKEDTRIDGPWEYGTRSTTKDNKNAQIAQKIREGNVLDLIHSGEINYVHYSSIIKYKTAVIE